jgi:hypothetical protein
MRKARSCTHICRVGKRGKKGNKKKESKLEGRNTVEVKPSRLERRREYSRSESAWESGTAVHIELSLLISRYQIKQLEIRAKNKQKPGLFDTADHP